MCIIISLPKPCPRAKPRQFSAMDLPDPRRPLRKRQRQCSPEGRPAPTIGVGVRPQQKQSKLALDLLKLWSWGHISLPTVQRIASNAVKDVKAALAAAASPGMENVNQTSPFDDLAFLASLGSDGKSVNNMHRDMIKGLTPPKLAQPCFPKLPLKTHGAGATEKEQGVLCPHAMFSSIYHNYKSTWRERIAPSAEVIRKFWDDMEEHPLMQRHEIRKRPDYKTKCIALKLHGDGAPVTAVGKPWQKSMDIFSWTVPAPPPHTRIQILEYS